MIPRVTPTTRELISELLEVSFPADGVGRAEVAAMLRVGGGVRVTQGRVCVEATVVSHGVAQRLARMLVELYRCTPAMTGRSGGTAYVRLSHGAQALAQRSGLLDRRGRPVVGMPPALVTAAVARPEVAAAAVRGAVLASGRITGQAGAVALRVRCGGLASAMAVRGFVRPCGGDATLRELPNGGGVCSVNVRDFKGLHPLLVAIGAPQTADAVVGTDEVTSLSHCQELLRTANRNRTVTAAKNISGRMSVALTILGDSLPGDLAETATLRLANPESSLSELGHMSNPPVNKNVIGGRLRRLLRAVDQASHSQEVSA